MAIRSAGWLLAVLLGALAVPGAMAGLSIAFAADRSAKFSKALGSSVWHLPLEGIRQLDYAEPGGLTLIAFKIFEPRVGSAGLEARVVAARDPKGETAVDVLNATGAVLVINGGYFDRAADGTLSPTGLLMSGGQTVAPLTACKACSGVLFVEKGKSLPGIVWAKSYAPSAATDYAVQTGPLLIEPGGKRGIAMSGGPLAQRSAICITRDKPARLIVVAVTSLVELYEFAAVLQGGFGCDVAINLDGGPSTQIATTVSGKLETFGNISPVQNFIAFYGPK